MKSEDPYRWCRRVFASVDIAGSTEFKHRSPEDSGKWANIFKLFFDEFPTTIRAGFEKVNMVADGRPVAPMEVWKFVGDEILFSAEIGRHEEVAYHAIIFKDAINEYSAELKRKPELSALSLKGTMWGAGFPVSNVEVAPKLGDGHRAMRDYLGPCVDQGFRLCSLADVRRIPISVDIAYMLATTLFAESPVPIRLQCEEPRFHKGVRLPYPHIWIDRLNGNQSEEDKILERRSAHEPSSIKSYLEELFAQKRPGLFKPFLVNDPSAFFNDIPQDMKEKRERLIQEAADQMYSDNEVATTGAPKASPPPPKLPPSA